MEPSEQLHDEPAEWPVVESHDLHRDEWVVALRQDVVALPDGSERFSRTTLEHPGAAVVLAVDEDERALCLRQYRHPNRRVFVELPAGLRDAGAEDSIDIARRELREEAELQAAEWRLLLSTFSSAGISTEVHDIYLARGLSHASRGDFEPHAEEAEMERLWVPVDELLDAVLAGHVRQGPLVQAVLAYQVLRGRGSL